MKLHQKLGKPIPEVKIPETKKPATTAATTSTTSAAATATSTAAKATMQKVNFVGGTKLNSTGGEEKSETQAASIQDNGNEIPPEGEPVGKLIILCN